MNVTQLKAIGQDIARLVRDYHGGPKREMLIDPALYVYLRLTARGRSVERQFHAHLPKQKRPARVDFRVKNPNAVLIEFAVRPPKGGGHLYGSQNRPELFKLTRFSNVSAKLRALLLIDLGQEPYDRVSLKKTYDEINAGRGKFKRHPVKVIYAHADKAFAFKWNPYRAV
jgi:hypothetical protein